MTQCKLLRFYFVWVWVSQPSVLHWFFNTVLLYLMTCPSWNVKRPPLRVLTRPPFFFFFAEKRPHWKLLIAWFNTACHWCIVSEWKGPPLASALDCHGSLFTFIRLNIEFSVGHGIANPVVDHRCLGPSPQWALSTLPLGPMNYCKVPRYVSRGSHGNKRTALRRGSR